MINRERVLKLVDALQSGEFEQCRTYLRGIDGYCPLGVACEVFRRETGLGNWERCRVELYRFVVGTETQIWALTDEVRDWYGFNSINPHIAVAGNWNATTRHNDGKNRSFVEIAEGFRQLIEDEQ